MMLGTTTPGFVVVVVGVGTVDVDVVDVLDVERE
jgi:hypothetical protein